MINELGLYESDWVAFFNLLLEVHNNKEAPITVNSLVKLLADKRIRSLGEDNAELL